MRAADLYEKDFARWADRNAALLRAGRLQEADLDHIAEEIEDMGKERRHALRSHLRRLLVHLLKHEFQPAKRSTSWLRSIASSRVDIADLIEENPSLKRLLDEFIETVYPGAVKLASTETKLPPIHLPSRCT